MIQILFTFQDRPPEVIRRPESDFYPGHWNKLGVSMETHHRAETIVATNLDTGKSVMLKNRWGPSAGMMDELLTKPEPLPKSRRMTVLRPDERYGGTTSVLPAVSSGVEPAFAAALPKELKGKFTISIRKPDGTYEKIGESDKLTYGTTFSKTVGVCKCDIKDLMTSGHVDECPEKKK